MQADKPSKVCAVLVIGTSAIIVAYFATLVQRGRRLATAVDVAGGHVDKVAFDLSPHLTKSLSLPGCPLEVHCESFPDSNIAIEAVSGEYWVDAYSKPKKNMGPIVEAIVAMPSIRAVFVDFTSTGDRELQRLSQCGNVEALGLSGTQVTKEGVRHLGHMPQLALLRIGYTAIDDSSVVELMKLTNLVHLDISATRITAEGVKRLASLPQLAVLGAIGLNLSAEDAAEISAARPSIRLLWQSLFNGKLNDDAPKTNLIF